VHPEEVFVAGTGSFAAEILDWIRAAGLQVRALIELVTAERIGDVRHGLPVVDLAPPQPGARAVIGLNGDRRAFWSRLAAHGWAPQTVVHPTATLAADAHLAAGVIVGPRAVVGAATAIEDHAIVSRGALIGHHVTVGEFATLNPGVNIAGNSRLGAGAFLGMGATVVNGVRVGEQAVIAAGAVVVKDVESGTRVQGVPARAVGSPSP
jgi:acetyltransferase EpsM